MDSVIQLLGRFHPLVVHLPIGILFLAFLFECVSRFPRFKALDIAVQPSLFIGSIFAIASIFTGLLLSEEGGYEEGLLSSHRNAGIATAFFTVVLYFFRMRSGRFFKNEKKLNTVRIVLFTPVIVLLSITGHQGGSMTHGEEFLFESLVVEQKEDPINKLSAITNLNDAIFYQDIIQPILDSKCYSCHSSKKIKGDLRLDQVEFILQGGKHGAVIEAGNPDSSSLYSRLMLPMEDELHMPPNERPQLSSSEISLIQTWLKEGANFDKRIEDFHESSKIKNYYGTLLAQLSQEPLIPAVEVSAADKEAIKALEEKRILILPVGNETNYLSVSFVNAASVTDADLALLLPLKKQLLWLNLGRTRITDEGLKVIAQLPALRQLHLSNTMISDEGIQHLTPLAELNYLNLVGINLTDVGLTHLAKMKKLKNIFVYQTEVTADGLKNLASQLPNALIDTGGYTLPTLASDSVVYRRDI